MGGFCPAPHAQLLQSSRALARWGRAMLRGFGSHADSYAAGGDRIRVVVAGASGVGKTTLVQACARPRVHAAAAARSAALSPPALQGA